MRSNLELFVLAMIQQGLGTPYDFKMKAGLSLGSVVPALARLEQDELIEGSEPGRRKSRRYITTPAGDRALSREWESNLNGRVNDLDSILRIAYLAWLNGKTREGAEFMEKSADALRGLAGSLRAEAARFASTVSDEPDGDAFKWLRTRCEAARVEAEAAALVELSGELNKKKTKNKKAKKKGQPRLRR
jgi:DNA-binding PadR family transcriptional regulator